ncbi:MAG: hypothetical protein CVU86_04330 [Firmicutes bacterium HGW-Firmicutes-11]|jgi:two-component system response regulator (stage 0 sporulation protein A)|nr:MAG: hypothetical protein CVU86_04330 [Firmicutes bacterium HGW-Firmicutes-11]
MEHDLDQRITELLNDMEVPYHCKGFQNLKLAIALAVRDEDILSAVTKELYPEVAKLNRTTVCGVERSIRNAIDLAWNLPGKCQGDKLYRFTYRNGKGRPTNRQLIAITSEKLRQEGL